MFPLLARAGHIKCAEEPVSERRGVHSDAA